jgi:LPS-assembly protein
VYSLQDNKALESFAGFEYRACCWRVRFGGRRYVNNHQGAQNTGIWLQLELTGLASVGSASDSFLTEAIRGYTPEQSSAQKLFKAP